MSSKVQICNRALQRLKADRITSLDDGTESAIACNTIFEQIVEEVISSNDWSRARRRVELAQTLNTPSFGYDYEYQLPVSPACLRVLAINECTNGEIEYTIEGDKLLCDESSVKILYTAMLDSSDDYGTHLTKAIVSKLASELAFGFAANATLVATLQSQYDKDLMEAAAADAVQGTAIDIRNDDYNRSRN